MLRRAAIGALLLLSLVVAVAPAVARGASAGSDDGDVVELRVWQDVRDERSLLVSARPEGGDWSALGTIPLPDSGTSADGSLRYGDIAVGAVELRVWQGLEDRRSISVSARREGGEWLDLGPLPLDDGHSTDGRFRYGDRRVVVPPPEPPPPVVVSLGGAEVPRLATLTIAFLDPPPEADGAALVSIDPPVEGSFVRADDRTLLFQPAWPGWLRGQRYELRVDAAAAGLAEDHVHAFTISGGLEVAYVIPGDGDREVPSEAQILVQFNRAVAALTVLQEGEAPPVLEFDPPIAGKGEWLNTSLYRFTPGEGLAPGARYRVRIPAALTSAADGVLQSDFAWSFATIQPAVARFEPQDGAKWVEPDGPFVVTFNQPMDRASVEAGLALRDGEGAPVAVSFEWSEGDTVATLTPAEVLTLGGFYQLEAPLGLRGAAGGGTESHRVAYFSVVAHPQLVSTGPHDGATGASPWDIRLQYNNPMDVESFEGRVSISGVDPADIEFSLRSSSWWQGVIVGVRLEYSTEYTVRIAEGVRDRGGRTLPAYEFSFTTEEPPPPEPPRPSLTLAVPASFVTFAAREQQVLHYYARAMDELRFRLYRLSEAEAETLLRRGFIDGWRANGEEEWVVFQPESEPLRRWTEAIETDSSDTVQPDSTVLSEGEPLPRGHYFLAMEYDDERYDEPRVSKLVLSVVDTAVVTKLAFDELIVWALDYETGAPLDGVTVSTAPLEDPPASPYQTAETDGDGLARFAVTQGVHYYHSGPHNLDRYYRYEDHLVRIEADGRSGVASTWWDTSASPWERELGYLPTPVGHLYTDRPIYRPGETVYYKGVLREDDDATYSLPGPAELTVTIRDPRGKDAHVATAQIDEFGTISGEFELPVDAVTGGYAVYLGRAGLGSPTWFTVAEFRAPEFEVEVATDAGDYVAGDAIATEARARFYFDGPVRDARVEWATLAWGTAIRVEGYEAYSFSDYDPYRSADSPRRWRPAQPPARPARTPRVIARFEVPATLAEGEGTHEFTISATVTDANGQAVANSTSVTVHPATWYAGIKPELLHRPTPGSPTTIHLVTVDFESRIAPAAPRDRARLSSASGCARRSAPADGGYSYRYELRDIGDRGAVRRRRTQAGEASRNVHSSEAPASYRLVAESLDDHERRRSLRRSFVWVGGSGPHAPWPERDNDVIELIADRERVRGRGRGRGAGARAVRRAPPHL